MIMFCSIWPLIYTQFKLQPTKSSLRRPYPRCHHCTWRRIQKDAWNHQCRSSNEHQIRLEIENINRPNCGQYDSNGRGEVLGNIVGVFDTNGNGKSTNSIPKSSEPNNGVESIQEAFFADGESVLEKGSKESGRDGEDSHLDVTHPDGHRSTAFENAFEIDAGESRDGTRSTCRCESCNLGRVEVLKRTLKNEPMTGFMLVSIFLDPPCCAWTRMTPADNTASEIHWIRANFLSNNNIENMATEKIFNWDTIWNLIGLKAGE